MTIFYDRNGCRFFSGTVGGGAPVRARHYNRQYLTARLLQSSKAVSLPGAFQATRLPHGIHPDGGAAFVSWLCLYHEQPVLLFDPDDYLGAVSPTFQDHGVKGRFVRIVVWDCCAPAAEIGRYGPGGADVSRLFAQSSEAAFYTGDGGASHNLDLSVGDFQYSFALLNGRLRVTFRDPAHQPAYRASAIFHVECSPLFPWKELT